MRFRLPVVALTFFFAAKSAMAANVVELWDQVQPPPAPVLSAATVKANETALLLLDIEEATCNKESRPRCVAAVPAMAAFLDKVRAANMPVFHSNTSRGSRATFLPPVAPRDSEPIVKSSVNKFFQTKLNDYLKGKGIKTVIVCGTTASGAVLHTATGAAQYGYQIVVPVDCMSGSSLYEEQASLWNLLNGPGTRRVLTATTLDAIKIEKIE